MMCKKLVYGLVIMYFLFIYIINKWDCFEDVFLLSQNSTQEKENFRIFTFSKSVWFYRIEI